MKLNKSKDNKPIYSGLSTLEIRKTVMCKFWFDYVKPMYQDKGNLSYIDTDIFVANIKTKDVYKDITNAFKNNVKYQIMQLKDNYQQVKVKKSDRINKR